MKKLLLSLLFFAMFSCLDDDVKYNESWDKVAVDRGGREYGGLDPLAVYCSGGWGLKFCQFLPKYEGTIWTATENIYGDHPDIKFSKPYTNEPFIHFSNNDGILSSCEGWKLGETSIDGVKWNIEIKVDEEDIFWFQYDFYGSGEEIEYSTIYKYEVIEGLLHFSSSEDQTFVFRPSERNYSIDCKGE